MIREERSGAFWNAVASHPEVRDRITLGGPLSDLTAIVEHPSVLPLAAEHGGFIFLSRDVSARVFELHTLFTPEGWGREVTLAAREAFTAVFLRDAALVFTLEVEINRRSRPPLSHGWRPAGPFAFAPDLAANVRTWVLTQDAWNTSPVRRRESCRSSLRLELA